MKLKKTISAGLAFLALGFFGSTASAAADKDELYKELRPLMETIALIQGSYVDIDKTASKALVEGAIKGMMGTLDPFSQYMDETESNDMKEETNGAFGGLGIEISVKNKELTVVSPIEDTPAYKAGIKSGDTILKINGEMTDGLELMDAVHKLRGEPGTKVTISVYRDGFVTPRDFTLTRAIIKIKSVKSNMLDAKTGYIRLSSFMGQSADDFDKALAEIKGKGAKDLIVDLRNNPGGLLDAAAEIADNFVPKGELIVYTDGRYKDKNIRFESQGGEAWKGGLAILINGGSASASEILAGAIQDHGLGVIVGTKSFGKGSVQTILPLSDGTAIRLTTAKYLTPKGRSIHGLGITPDFISEDVLYSKSYLDLSDAGAFEGFAKSYLLAHPGYVWDEDDSAKKPVKVSEDMEHLKPETKDSKLLQDFIDEARVKYKGNDDDIIRDHILVVARIKEEMTRIQKGEDAARLVALQNDAQIKDALNVLKVVNMVQTHDKAARVK